MLPDEIKPATSHESINILLFGMKKRIVQTVVKFFTISITKLWRGTKVRVLHISSADDVQGSAKCLYELLNYEMSIPELEIIVITPCHSGVNDFCEKNGIKNFVINYSECFYTKHDELWLYKYILRKAQYSATKKQSISQLEKVVDISLIDVIHTNNSIIDFGHFLSEKYSIPHVWHLREGGLKPFNNIPYKKDFIEKWITNSNTTFLAVSNATREIWSELGIPLERIKVIYDGVAYPNDIILKKKKNEKVKFVMSGGINNIKGIIEVVKAICIMPDSFREKITLDIWGKNDPDYLDNLNKVIQQNQLADRIHIKGFSNDIWATLCEYDMGINCTNFEAFGRSTIEMLMMGIPVISNRTGANIELVKEEKNGLFFERENIQSIADALVKAVNMKDQLVRYTYNERTNTICNFSSDKSCKEVVTLFSNLIQ